MELEILKLHDRIEIALELGESHYREFKSAYEGAPANKVPRNPKDICRDIARTLVAFANADGGELLIGVEDSSQITGIPFSEDIVRCILLAPKEYVHHETPLPNYKYRLLKYNSEEIIYFSIPKGSQYVYLTSDGRCLQRRDLETVPISSEQIKFTREEERSREYDRDYLESAKMSDIDIELLKNVSDQLSIQITPEKFLQHLELAEFDGEVLRLKRAALLLFAKQPNKWHPRLQVRVVKIEGNELKSGNEFNVSKDEEVSAGILTLIEKGWEILRPHLTETRMSKNALFKTQIIYPELACKEALINAIAHRDYSIEGRGIEVFVYYNRIDFVSPGELLSSIKIDDLKALRGTHQSRNSYIAKTLREIGYMRELGEGIRRIYELLESNDLAPPEFESQNNSFKITLSQKLVYSKEEKLWLDNFEHLDLDREQKTVVRLGANGRLISPNDIWEAVGIVDTDKYRQLLESLSEMGLMTRQIDRNKAYFIAKNSKISKKDIKQFQIHVPEFHSSQKSPTYIKKQSPTPVTDEMDYAKVFVWNIPYTTSNSAIESLFEQFGEISRVYMPRSRDTNIGKGYAFVEFDELAGAKAAIAKSGTVEIDERKIYVRQYEQKGI